MATVIDKTIHSKKPYSFTTEPSMMTRTLAHHFFEASAKRRHGDVRNDAKELAQNGTNDVNVVENGVNGYIGNGVPDDVLLINFRNPTVDVLKRNDLEIRSRFGKPFFLLKD